jgi:ATP-dependent RNA helicase DDX59
MQTLPVALTGAHVLVSAPTGTGKTAAFLLPLVVQILETRFDMETSVPLGLVLAPIRELAIQIEDAAKVFMKGIQKMKTALVVGGLPMPPQLHRLQQGVQLVVATPGRLVDILVHHSDDCNGLDELLAHVRCCVVDEVDMMLSVGFRDAVTQILGSLLSSADRVQFIFTSATISKQVEQVVSSFLGSRSASYVRIRVGDDSCVNGSDVGSALTLHANVDHSLRWLEENDKKTELFHMLQERGARQTVRYV